MNFSPLFPKPFPNETANLRPPPQLCQIMMYGSTSLSKNPSLAWIRRVHVESILSSLHFARALISQCDERHTTWQDLLGYCRIFNAPSTVTYISLYYVFLHSCIARLPWDFRDIIVNNRIIVFLNMMLFQAITSIKEDSRMIIFLILFFLSHPTTPKLGGDGNWGGI